MKTATHLEKSNIPFFHSIRFRLLLWFTAILMLVLIFFSAFVYYNQKRDIERDSLERAAIRLSGLQEDLRASLPQENGQGILPEHILEEREVLALIDSRGQIFASYGNFPEGDIVQAATQAMQNRSGHEESYEDFASWIDKNSNYRFVVKPVLGKAGETSLAVLGSPLDPNGQLNGLLTSLLLGNLFTLAIALGGGYWLADRSLRPVQAITQTARHISETDLSRRINLESKDEFGELANTFDSMLSRLQISFERQRQFVANASHELRTPLTIVNLETSRALAARRSAQEYERALRVIHSENDFMSHLVNDLLTLARMDNGQVTLKKVPLDLSDVAVDAIERLTPLASRNNVKLAIGDLPEARILGERQSLLQMVSNLIENAIKYTDGDDKKVCVEVRLVDGCAWIRVSDNGPGIAPQHLPHLFDRFYRADPARARVMDNDTDPNPDTPSGSGLGLSIIQWIAQAHGGEVLVESTLGSGSKFEVRFGAL